jgi:hypothetical protein
VTDGPSLPPPRYAHTLHVEAPQPKPFSFLLGVALLAFAVPAGLVFAFLRVVAEPAVPAAATALEAPPVEPVAPSSAPAESEPALAADAVDAVDAASPLDAGLVVVAAALVDASPAVLAPIVAPVVASPPPPAPPPPVIMTYELGMGILHSCRSEAGKVFEGYQDCGSAGELDRYLSKVVGQRVGACTEGAPTSSVTVRTHVDFASFSGSIDVVDGKMIPVPSPWATCLSSHFALENLPKIRHLHPRYTLTYRVIPHPLGAGTR